MDILEISLVNEALRDKISIKTSYDWPAFWSPFIFGIPHLLRKQYDLGAAFLLMSIAGFFIPIPEDDVGLIVTFLLIFGFYLALMIYMGSIGRRLYCKYLISKEYQFESEESEIVSHYKSKWGIM